METPHVKPDAVLKGTDGTECPQGLWSDDGRGQGLSYFFSSFSVQALGGSDLSVTCMPVFLIKLPRTEVAASEALRVRLDAEGSFQSRNRTQESRRKPQLL